MIKDRKFIVYKTEGENITPGEFRQCEKGILVALDLSVSKHVNELEIVVNESEAERKKAALRSFFWSETNTQLSEEELSRLIEVMNKL